MTWTDSGGIRNRPVWWGFFLILECGLRFCAERSGRSGRGARRRFDLADCLSTRVVLKTFSSAWRQAGWLARSVVGCVRDGCGLYLEPAGIKYGLYLEAAGISG